MGRMKLLAALIFTFSQGVVANEECTALGNSLPCTDSGNKFATKTITEKYRLMKQCGWKKTDRLAQFCPYQTALCGEQARIHFWPECANDYTPSTAREFNSQSAARSTFQTLRWRKRDATTPAE